MSGTKDYNLYQTEKGVYCYKESDTNELSLIENFEQKFGKLIGVHPSMHNCIIHTIKDYEPKIYVWGSNSYNCMGSSETIINYPEITEFENFYRLYGTPLIIERGLWHTVYYVDTGNSYEVYVCGFNHVGQLGIKGVFKRLVKIKNFTDLYGEILDIRCGSSDTIFRVNKDDKIKFYVCGYVAQKKLKLTSDKMLFAELKSSTIDLSEISSFLCDNDNYFFYSKTTNKLFWCDLGFRLFFYYPKEHNMVLSEFHNFSKYGELISMNKGYISTFIQTTLGVLQISVGRIHFEKNFFPHLIQYGYGTTYFHFLQDDKYQIYGGKNITNIFEDYHDFVKKYGFPIEIKKHTLKSANFNY